jgi:hypothetical protein
MIGGAEACATGAPATALVLIAVMNDGTTT